jgi:autotransporter translocation and assembly factor TamB
MELPDLIARSRIDVRIRESDRIWIDNNLARIRLRADVGVIGTPLRPNFTGLVRVEEGYLLYLDRRFKVNEGTVYFTEPNRFNPDIKLDARTQITIYRRTSAEPYTIYIQAEGYLDQLRYGLFSEPALDRPDIVALLTLGATRSELTKSSESNGRSGLSQVLKDRAAMLTSQRLSGYVSRKAGAVFGFDEFTIQGNLFQFDDSWGPQLVASKRLSQRVDLTYSTTVGHLNDQSVRLGYRLTPRWSLMGETDRQGRSGLDLKYGIKFK